MQAVRILQQFKGDPQPFGIDADLHLDERHVRQLVLKRLGPAPERERDTPHIAPAAPIESVAARVFGFERFVIGRMLVVVVRVEMIPIQDVLKHKLNKRALHDLLWKITADSYIYIMKIIIVFLDRAGMYRRGRLSQKFVSQVTHRSRSNQTSCIFFSECYPTCDSSSYAINLTAMTDKFLFANFNPNQRRHQMMAQPSPRDASEGLWTAR